MAQNFSISISEIVDLLSLECNPSESRDKGSFNVRCPFCNDRGYHMNINTVKNTYRCVLCMPDEKGTGALDLYGRVAFGTPCVKGHNGNSKLLFRKLCDALHIGSPQFVATRERKEPEFHDIVPASDDVLNHTYQILLSLPYLSLIPAHRANLERRGLRDETIKRNGYASLPSANNLVETHPAKHRCKKLYTEKGIDAIRANSPVLKNCRAYDILAGLLIANDCIREGATLKGVPGFFKIADLWCFRYDTGMMIPTRNMKGEIVGLQLRISTGKLRYMTISSKGLPEGVTTRISRAHFPLANAKLSADLPVFITEGPLKADVALDLMRRKTLFIALQGVNNSRELDDIFPILRDAGIRKIFNVFDMDKLTNHNVAAAGKSIREKAKRYGLDMAVKCWDMQYAYQKFFELAGIFGSHQLSVPECENLYVKIGIMSEILYDLKIPHSQTVRPDGTVEKHYWNDQTKGVDDYLLSDKVQ